MHKCVVCGIEKRSFDAMSNHMREDHKPRTDWRDILHGAPDNCDHLGTIEGDLDFFIMQRHTERGLR